MSAAAPANPASLASSAGATAVKPGVNPWLVAVTVSMATFMEVLDVSIANVSLRHIAGDMGAGPSESTWVLTSYLVSNAVVLPISGWLSSVVGRKRFYMICVAVFAGSSLLCGLAPSLGWLLFFRVLQGIGGGGLAPSEQAILADTFPPAKRGMAFAVYGVAVVVAPAIGPALGGWITDNYDWRWIFFINLPIGALSLFLTGRLVQDSDNAKREHADVWRGGLKIDYVGFVLVCLGLGALQVVLDKGQEEDWFGSSFIVTFAVLCAVGLVGLVVWEVWGTRDPVVDLPLLRNKSFAASNLFMFIVGFVLNSTTVLIPQFVQDLLGYDATHAGLLLMPGGFVLMLMFPLAGRLSGLVQPKYLIVVGLLATSAAMFHLTGFSDQASFGTLAWARIYLVVGLPLFFISINVLAYGGLPPGKTNNASALVNLMRNLGGSIGIAVAITLLDRRQQVHRDRLVSNLTPYDPAFQQRLTGGHGVWGGGGDYASVPAPAGLGAGGGGHGGGSSLAAIAEEVRRQAMLLSYLDVFKIMAVCTLCTIVFVPLLRRVRTGEQAQGH
ncbi:MAG: disulfide bond formation protein DsbA [Phycisphaerales bacterium]|nr:disulfide bond formation protein DsbA [Phycisphaerales bacterium]